jgi:hypothetical protein
MYFNKTFASCFTLFSLTFFMIILALAVPSVEAATLHGIIVADSHDRELGTEMKVDLNRVHKHLNIAANKSAMAAKIVTIAGSAAKRAVVLSELKKLKVADDDVVVVYFSLHGYRTPDKDSIWPNLYFGKSDNGIELEYILVQLKKKQPRLLIVLADVCNSYVEKGAIATLKALPLVKQPPANNENEGYHKLFRCYSGEIVVSSSLPGDDSWSDADVGSYMTASFFKSLGQVVLLPSAEVTWESVMERIGGHIDHLLNDDLPKKAKRLVQIPQYELDLYRLSTDPNDG